MIFWRDAEEVANYENPLPMIAEEGASTEVESVRTTPRIMVAATVAMVAVSVGLTVFATPLFDLSANAGENIDGPGYYVTTVFPGGFE